MKNFSVKNLVLALTLGGGVAHSAAIYGKSASDPHEKGAAADPAAAAVLQMNSEMFGYYEQSLADFQKKLLAESPVILGLFSGSGGRFFLYRPNEKPLEAPGVAPVYQLAKSVGHASMAIYSILTPSLPSPQLNRDWIEPLKKYRKSQEQGRDQVPHLQIAANEKKILEEALTKNIAFMSACLEKGTYTQEDLNQFGVNIKPDIIKIVQIAATVQADHWIKVLGEWKKILGEKWEKTYAMTNTLYVTRQNNILFTILAQFMGQKAINHRLLLIETPSFTTKPDEMLGLLSRILNDRQLRKTYFNDGMLMDYELLGSASREAVKSALKKRGQESFFPEYAPFNSTEWPWHNNPTFGTGPRTIEETH